MLSFIYSRVIHAQKNLLLLIYSNGKLPEKVYSKLLPENCVLLQERGPQKRYKLFSKLLFEIGTNKKTGLVSLSNGISNFVGYLMPKPSS